MQLAALLALALAATGPRLEGSLAAGAGYDSNLNHAASIGQSVDAAFGFVRASGGASLELGGSTSIFGGLRADLERYSGVSDLGSTAASLEAALVQDLGWRVALVLAPSALRTWTGDPGRDATGIAGRLTLRAKPTRYVALRAFYAYSEQSAEDPTFSSKAHRAGASAEWNPRGRTYLSVGYAAVIGDEVFYRAVASGGTPGMGGRMVDTFGRNEEAFRADAFAQSVTAALEVGLGAKAHLFASYEFRRVTSDEPAFVVHATTVGVGIRP